MIDFISYALGHFLEKGSEHDIHSSGGSALRRRSADSPNGLTAALQLLAAGMAGVLLYLRQRKKTKIYA